MKADADYDGDERDVGNVIMFREEKVDEANEDNEKQEDSNVQQREYAIHNRGHIK